MVVIIRGATLNDAKGLGLTQVEAMKVGFKGILTDVFLNSINADEQGMKYAERAQLPDHRVYVADVDGEVVGFFCIGPAKRYGDQFEVELYALYVMPNMIGKGIGSALMDKVKDVCKSDNFSSLIVWCFAENKSANQCYERNGGERLLLTDPPEEYLDEPHVSYGWSFL